VRENAEAKVFTRLDVFRSLKRRRERGGIGARPVIGVLGCMAERLKGRLLEDDRLADVVVGPDAYRDLPRLLQAVRGGESGGTAMNVQLSLEETYADVLPLRDAGRAAYLSVMRGCDNHCAFCIVPHTRGRERSRPAASVVEEVRLLSQQGCREVTLLGQNVNSYADFSEAAGGVAGRPAALPSSAPDAFSAYAPGFRSIYVPRREGAIPFAELLQRCAEVDPEMRIRFTRCDWRHAARRRRRILRSSPPARIPKTSRQRCWTSSAATPTSASSCICRCRAAAAACCSACGAATAASRTWS
jgi:tRNA A37 methylthiotransferase MiaB